MIVKPLPIGIDDFGKLITNGYYYVDKTLFIRELLDKKGEVNLFTRPRRFGKTLNLSMLRYYLEDTGDEKLNTLNKNLFCGLNIMKQEKRYTAEMGKYPVISLSLKTSKQPDFELALTGLKRQIASEFRRHEGICSRLLGVYGVRFKRIMEEKAERTDYIDALAFLSECLHRVYQTKCVILIDEYDVPLENAYFCGFYDEMSAFLRSLFESALKTNPFLEFAVITGCLRITKESIFTGLNNLEIISILSGIYSEHFGFTKTEVEKMAAYYGLEHHLDTLAKWYDGYVFGKSKVYNPWSVINHIKVLYSDTEALPAPYWANTSSNDIVRTLIEQADFTVKQEVETLLMGQTIEKPIYEEITYADIEKSQDNLWNFLFFTGYLKQVSKRIEGVRRLVTMAIPNAEVSYIYENVILSWFEDHLESKNLENLYQAIRSGDVDTMRVEISSNLQETISFYDYGESYYHGFLAGLLKHMSGYQILSNREAGSGRPDLVLKTPGINGQVIILELKTVKKYSQMEQGCDNALHQIAEQKYARDFADGGYTNIVEYGICFYQKDCLIKKR